MKIKYHSAAIISLIIINLAFAGVVMMYMQKASEPMVKYLLEIREEEKHVTGSICRFKHDDWRFNSAWVIKREIVPENLVSILNHKKYNLEDHDYVPDLILIPNPNGEVWIIRNQDTEEWSVVSNNFRVPKKEYITVFITDPQ